MLPTFKVWLRSQCNRPGAIGDFARDAIRDKELPRGRPSLYVLIEYMNARGASANAIEAMRLAWEEWTDVCARLSGGVD